MHYTLQLGVAAPELGWVPAPRYILRRSAVLHLLNGAPPGRVLEVGCGAGGLLYDLAQRGFTGVGVEESPRALDLAARLLADSPGVRISAALPDAGEPFDYLMSFEVLEHIEDDCGALAQWAGYLRPGGTLLLSVPAHMSKWSSSDVWAGHYRRYEADDLRTKAQEAGFTVEALVSYGWPLSNLVEPIRAAVHRRRLRRAQEQGRDPSADKKAQTDGSGVERDAEMRLYPLYSTPPGRAFFAAFSAVQRWFFRRDWGTGYLLKGRKA